MASYTYKSVSQNGKKHSGKIEAQDQQEAIAALKRKGETVIEIGNTTVLGSDIKLPFLQKKIKVRDLSVFCRQMATNIEAGITIINALAVVENQTENKVFKNVIREIRIDVEKGSSLAEAMEKHERIFTALFVHMIDAGESSGNLEKSFYQMAGHYEKIYKLQSVVKRAMTYPIIIMVIAVVVLIVMMTVIIPNFMTMFESMDVELPAFTKAVVAVSDWFVKYWYLLILGIAVITFLFHMFANTEKGVYTIASIKMKAPVFGKLNVKQNCAQFARNLSVLISSGVPLIQALDIVARTMNNQYYVDAVKDAKDQVARGIPLSEPLRKSGVFPPMVYNMVAIGEETGAMEQMLEKVAEYYEEEVEATTAQLSAMLEPLMIVFMAGIVIIIIAAVFGPMLTMYNAMDSL